MSLQFTDNGSERVDCGSDASLDDWTAFTYITLLKLDDTTGFRFGRIVSKGDDIKELSFDGTGSSNSARLRFRVNRATTDANVQMAGDVDIGWMIYAATYDESDGPRIFQTTGGLHNVLDEVGGTPTVGSGATTADAANNLWIGNRSTGSTNRSFGGRIARVAVIKERLTLKQLNAIKWRFINALTYDCRGLWYLGYPEASTIPDLSGNKNNGTVTGATIANHAEIAPDSARLWGHGPLIEAAAAGAPGEDDDFPLLGPAPNLAHVAVYS